MKNTPKLGVAFLYSLARGIDYYVLGVPAVILTTHYVAPRGKDQTGDVCAAGIYSFPVLGFAGADNFYLDKRHTGK